MLSNCRRHLIFCRTWSSVPREIRAECKSARQACGVSWSLPSKILSSVNPETTESALRASYYKDRPTFGLEAGVTVSGRRADPPLEDLPIEVRQTYPT